MGVTIYTGGEIMSSIVHFELSNENRNLLKDFYSKVFDWKYETLQPVSYDLIFTKENPDESGINGGFQEDNSMSQKIILTIDVKEIESTIADIKLHGGDIITDIQEMPGIGRLAYFKDPEGTIMGIMQSAN